MIGWTVVASCTSCGAPLEPVTEGNVVGNECSAIAACSVCHHEHHLRVELVNLTALASSNAQHGVKRPRRAA